jgi:transcriptional regulator with XRE-family HTH domain
MPPFDSERVDLGDRLREAREYLELSQDEVAKALKIPRSAISLIESGQRRVDALELRELAKLYQCSVASLSGEESPAAMPEDVAHLARAAATLTENDRSELARFAEFLRSRTSAREGK